MFRIELFTYGTQTALYEQCIYTS